jgi:hypothetical protein
MSDEKPDKIKLLMKILSGRRETGLYIAEKTAIE